MVIVVLFVTHWVTSVFFQSFFQHRYARPPDVHHVSADGARAPPAHLPRPGPVVPRRRAGTRSCTASTTRSATPSGIRTRPRFYSQRV